MTFGLGRLAWSPEQFWAATPREIHAALRAFRDLADGGVPDRAALEQLLGLYPDDPRTFGDDRDGNR